MCTIIAQKHWKASFWGTGTKNAILPVVTIASWMGPLVPLSPGMMARILLLDIGPGWKNLDEKFTKTSHDLSVRSETKALSPWKRPLGSRWGLKCSHWSRCRLCARVERWLPRSFASYGDSCCQKTLINMVKKRLLSQAERPKLDFLGAFIMMVAWVTFHITIK